MVRSLQHSGFRGPLKGDDKSPFAKNWPLYAGTGKVFVPTTPKSAAGHSVVITGWGTDKETKVDYWEMRNTWGEANGPGSGYYRYAMSTSIPKAYWTGLDIPLDVGNGDYQGGAVSMLPGPLPKGEWGKGKGDGPVGSGWKPAPMKLKWLPIVGIGLGVIIAILLLALFFNKEPTEHGKI